jgi:FHS family L-fucose permease-like MFS transporter
MYTSVQTGYLKNASILARYGVVFFMWGLLTNLNFFLIKYLVYIFKLSYSFSTLLGLTFFGAFLFASIPAGNLFNRIGFRKGILAGVLTCCAGCFGFAFAIQIRSFNSFLFALFLLATGITMLQVGANLYVVLFGDKKTAASRLNLVQAFNSLGTIVAPFLAAKMLWYIVGLPKDLYISLKPEDLILMEGPYIQYIYLYLGIIILIYAVFIKYSNIPQINTKAVEPLNKITSLRRRHVLHFSQLRLGAFAIFAYVGAEVALGNYLRDFATDFTDYYWELAMVGRFIGALLMLKVSPRILVGICAGTAFLLLVVSILTTGLVSVWSITLIGLFNSILFPTIFSLGVNGLGKYSINGSSILIMSITGGALIPFMVGNFSYVNHEVAFVIPLICYLYVVLYGIKFSRFEKQ